jgi:hypothetical protein
LQNSLKSPDKSSQSTNLDIFSFFGFHEKQKDFFKRSSVDIKNFIEKYVEPP